MKHRKFAVVIIAQLFTITALAQEKPWIDRLTIDGKGFLKYSRELGGAGGSFNEFNIDRIYLGLSWKIGDQTKLRYLLEGGDLRDGAATTASPTATGPFVTTTKQFYIETKDVLFNGSFVRLGLGDLPWVGFIDGIWSYRIQGTNFTDRSGYLTSTDLGVSFGSAIREKFGDWQISFVNGEGWKSREIGTRKDGHVRLTIKPLADNEGFLGSLFLAGGMTYGYYDDIANANDSFKKRYHAAAGFKKSQTATLFAEAVTTKDPASKMKTKHPSLPVGTGGVTGSGFAVYGVLNFFCVGFKDAGENAKKWELIARYEQLDPDTGLANNTLKRGIGGVSYAWNKNVMSLLDYEQVVYQSASAAKNEKRVLFQTEVKF